MSRTSLKRFTQAWWTLMGLMLPALLVLETLPLAHHHHEEEHVCVEDSGTFHEVDFTESDRTESDHPFQVSALHVGDAHDHPVCGLCFIASKWKIEAQSATSFDGAEQVYVTDWALAHVSAAALTYRPRGPPLFSSRRTS